MPDLQMENHASTLPGRTSRRFDDLPRYVRIRRIVKDNFVEFDFAIGDPTLYVELILPKAAFDSFCHHNRVIRMTDEQAAAVDADMVKWRYGDQK